MTRMDFKKAVPETPLAFTEAMRKAMNDMQEDEKRRRKPKTLLIAAIVGTLLLIGTAFALTNGFGVFNFWEASQRGEVLPDAIQLVQSLSDMAAVETRRVHYRALDAAATDGMISITVVAQLKEPEKYVLMDEDGRGDPLTVFEGTDKTYEQFAIESGKTLLCVEPSLELDGVEVTNYGTQSKLDGNALYLYMNAECDKSIAAYVISVDCTVSDYEIYGATQNAHSVQIHSGKPEKATISFEIESKSEVLESRTFDGNWPMGEITVERVSVERTPFYTRVSVTYLAPDETPSDAVLASFFFTSDAEGEKPFEGDNEKAMTSHIEGNHFKTVRYWQAMAELPETIYLRPFFWDNNQWGEVIALTTKDGRMNA